MNIKKIICAVLLLNALIVSGYASDSICTKDGVCFEVIFQEPIESIFENDPWWGSKSFAEQVISNIKWGWLLNDERAAERIHYIKKLLQNLKIRVNGKDLEVIPGEVVTNDCAVIRLVEPTYCVLRVVSVSMQRVFDITIKLWSNGLKIREADDIKEISKAEYPIPQREESQKGRPDETVDKEQGAFNCTSVPVNEEAASSSQNTTASNPPTSSQKKEEKVQESFIQVNSTPFLHEGIAFTLVSANGHSFSKAQNIKELVNLNGLKLRVHDRELELMSTDCGSSDRATVYALMEEQCVIRMVSVSAQRIFDIAVSIKDGEVVISGIKEMPKREYFSEHLRTLGLACSLEIDRTPVYYQSYTYGKVEFALVPTIESDWICLQDIKELLKIKGFKISVHHHDSSLKESYELEVLDKDIELGIRGKNAVIYSLNNNECLIKIKIWRNEFFGQNRFSYFDVKISLLDNMVKIINVM